MRTGRTASGEAAHAQAPHCCAWCPEADCKLTSCVCRYVGLVQDGILLKLVRLTTATAVLVSAAASTIDEPASINILCAVQRCAGARRVPHNCSSCLWPCRRWMRTLPW